MMWVVVGASLGMLLGVAGATASDEATVEYLTRMEHEFAQATLAGDFSRVESLLAPDFVGVDPQGHELSREDVMAGFRNPDRTIESLRHEDLRVHLFGDCAVVLGVTVIEGRYKGEPVGGEFPYMRVWVERGGRWLAVATQSTAAGH